MLYFYFVTFAEQDKHVRWLSVVVGIFAHFDIRMIDDSELVID